MDTLRARQLIRFGWDTFKKRPWFFVGSFLVLTVFSNVSFEARDLGIENVTPTVAGAFFVLSIATFVVTTIARMCASAFLLKAHAAPETVAFADMWAPRPFWRFVGAALLKGLIVAGPMAAAFILGAIALGMSQILFVVAVVLGTAAFVWAVYAGVRLMFVELIVMDRGTMPVDALRESYRMTDGSFWRLVALMLASIGVIILGLAVLVVGVLAAIPIVMLAYVHAYRLLENRSVA